MHLTNEILSKITVFTKYAKYDDSKKRREDWEEIVTRNRDMHIKRYPWLEEEIRHVYNEYVMTKKVLPSMRSLQFGGKPIEISPNRVFNCAYMPVDSIYSFSEAMFLLLGGTGVGYSVQRHHISQLPEITKPKSRVRRFLISDNIEGWADAIKVLLEAYFLNKSTPKFDFSDIRPKGARLITSGGKAPGSAPLKFALQKIKDLLDTKNIGDKLSTIECHDIMCYIADAVLAGGIRRAALISLFSLDDKEMISSKSSSVKSEIISKTPVKYITSNGLETDPTKMLIDVKQGDKIYHNIELRRDEASGMFYDLMQHENDGTLGWWVCNPQRGRANNSAVILRHKIRKAEFKKLWKAVELSGAGEPGVYLSNDKDWGTNPCCLSGDSRLLTTDGYKELAELDGEDNLRLINKNGEEVLGSVWKTGEKEVFEIRAGNTKNPLIIKATKDHRFMLDDGDEAETANLYGRRLMPFYNLKDWSDEKLLHHVKIGFVQGDGSIRKNTDSFKNVQVSFTPEKDDEVKSLFSKTGWTTNNTSMTVDVSNEHLKDIGFDFSRVYERVLPTYIETATDDEKLAFLCGLYSANGTVIRNGNRVALKTTSKKLAQQIMPILNEFGIDSYITTNKPKMVKFHNGDYVCKESYDVNITKLDSIIKFASKISFIQTYKTDRLEDIIVAKSPYVYSIKSLGVQTVYDFNLQDDTHWGVVNGIVTHNCEIALRPYQFCNLTEVNASNIESQEDLNARARAAAFIGTLQAGYTDFHYLRPIWQENTEKDALIGVGMTGIGSGVVLDFNLAEASQNVLDENARIAEAIGINKAARTTTVKPSGTSSMVLGSASGIHAWHNDYYIRRMRLGKDESIYKYLRDNHPELVVDDVTLPDLQAIVEIPQAAPEGSILRTESPEQLLERVRRFNEEWVHTGHRDGQNTHNVSCTISLREDEWDMCGEWMWANRNKFNGISVLPYNGGTYKQAPFEDITKERFDEMVKHLHDIDLRNVIEEEDMTDLSGEIACSGGVCENVM